jgi:hypothetical protein
VYRSRGERFTDQCVYTRPTVLEAEVLPVADLEGRAGRAPPLKFAKHMLFNVN